MACRSSFGPFLTMLAFVIACPVRAHRGRRSQRIVKVLHGKFVEIGFPSCPPRKKKPENGQSSSWKICRNPLTGVLMVGRKSTEMKQGALLKKSKRDAVAHFQHARSKSPDPANARTPPPAPRTPPPARSRSGTPVNDRYRGLVDHTKGIRVMDDIPTAPKNSYRAPRRSRSRSCADE
uniref:Secreted protein n=1 Tax=Steinernema glaseri TaxID=37863 RepID=A0A1I7YSK7_9BILA